MTFRKIALAALVSAGFVSAMPQAATAQVQGIATADTSVAIARAKALSAAYQQINTQYQSYNTQIEAKLKEINSLNAQLDTNKDKVLDQAELDAAVQAKNPVLNQIQTKRKEINDLREPIAKAQMFAIGEIAKQYNVAQEAVVKSKKINLILAPDAFLWAPPTVDVTPAITTELDRLVPSVATVPPANWQPSRQIAAVYQSIQQLLGQAARAQAAQAAQQQGQPAAQPSGR